jgi:hypothetical protein
MVGDLPPENVGDFGASDSFIKNNFLIAFPFSLL